MEHNFYTENEYWPLLLKDLMISVEYSGEDFDGNGLMVETGMWIGLFK